MTFFKTIEGKQTPIKESELTQYKAICKIIWGATPYDYTWAVGTPIYAQALAKYLSK